jgi:hypothetical protein
MNRKFSLYRYSSKYQYEILEYRNNVFYAIYPIHRVLKEKEKEKKDQYEWLKENYPEFCI